MPSEIERKFLVADPHWHEVVQPDSVIEIEQGYLCADEARSVRVRVAAGGAELTVKSAAEGLTRAEFEYAIPFADGLRLLKLCGDRRVQKRRYAVSFGGKQWSVDEFTGRNAGLVVAEIELDREDEEIQTPPWLGAEVSQRPEYANASLAAKPFCQWQTEGEAGTADRVSGSDNRPVTP